MRRLRIVSSFTLLFDFRASLRKTRKHKRKIARRARLYLYTRKQLQQALDPVTDPARLSMLLRLRSLAAAITANPNTPPALLRILCARYPLDFFSNPSLPLLLLEDPNFFSAIPESAMLQLLAHPKCTNEYIELAMMHPSSAVHGFIASNPKTPKPLLLELFRRDLAINSLAINPGIPAEIAIGLAESRYNSTRQTAALNPSLPRQHLRLLQHTSGCLDLGHMTDTIVGVEVHSLVLLSQGGTFARELAARHPDTPADRLAALSRDEEESVCQLAAQNPSTPSDALDALCGSPLFGVRTALAQNTSISEQSLKRLARDSEPRVRLYVALHPKLPVFLLGGLARDEADEVRGAVLQSSRVTPQILASMVHDPEHKIRLRLAHHKKTPKETLDILRNDPHPEVRRAGKRG